MNTHSDRDPIDSVFAALLQRAPEPPDGLRRQLDTTIPTPPRKGKTMLLRLSLGAVACSTLALYCLRPSLARPVPYVKTIQQIRALPFFHIRLRQRSDVRESHWLTQEIWFDQAHGLRIGPLSGVASPEEMLMLPNDTLYWKHDKDVMVLRGEGSWKKTYERELKSVQDFPADVLLEQATPAKAVSGQWQGRAVYIYKLTLNSGGQRTFVRLYIDASTHLLVAQQRTVKVGAQELLKEEYLYDYDTRPSTTYFDVARFHQAPQ